MRSWRPEGGDTQVVHAQKSLRGEELWNKWPNSHPLITAWLLAILSGRHTALQRRKWLQFSNSWFDRQIACADSGKKNPTGKPEASARMQEPFISCLDAFNSLPTGFLTSISTLQPEKIKKGLLKGYYVPAENSSTAPTCQPKSSFFRLTYRPLLPSQTRFSLWASAPHLFQRLSPFLTVSHSCCRQ